MLQFPLSDIIMYASIDVHSASDKARYVNKRALFWTWKALSELPSMSSAAGLTPSGA